MPRPFLLAVLVCVLVVGARAAADAPVRVERVSGEPVQAQRLVAIAGDDVVLAADAGEVKAPLADVIEIGFATPPDPPPAWTARSIAVDFASGETLVGELKAGDQEGFTVTSALVGDVEASIDAVAAVRFLRRLSQILEPPDLHAPETTDVVHLENADRMACTVEEFGEKSVAVESSMRDKTVVPYDKIVALRIAGRPAKRPAGTLLLVVLRDGSQLIGGSPAAKDGRLKMTSVSGFAVDAALTDVVAAHVVSDRFAYLSDLPSTLEVKPFWKPAAGDPNVLYAPRADRSFADRPLKCAGRAWVKGVGVYSGTSMTWALDGGYREFRASCGVDDGAGALGGVVFEVLVDGQSKWTSGFVRAAAADGRGKPGPIAIPHIDVKGAKTLTLRVLSGDADDPWPIADEADWLGAMLVR
jgi:hypothetical protein